ncbi:MAG TPA: S41 family peptidase [Verrucomicrobiae bacterium]|jgi:C-terminal processing protease CtpA/Prc|nr:S41 family peptidase [Verrucomicrobiae bacterium]
MTRSGLIPLLTAVLAIASQISLSAQTNDAAPNFQEVYDLIRQHATGVSEAELNRAAVEGLVTALGPKVSLVTNNSTEDTATKTQLLTQSTIFEGDIAYLRIARVDEGLARAVRDAYQQLKSTNKVSGIVLDLRYADGAGYPAAAAVADLFASKSQPLLNEGKGMISSHEKKDAITTPVAVLVNHETAGAPEALAAMIRETGAGLILGSPTAGAAMLMQEYPLKDGERLRIASAPITLGDGTPLPAQGLKPDIDVTVSEKAERAFYADAFRVVPDAKQATGASATNVTPPYYRLNEAELVREHKAGENPEEQTAARPPEPQAPVVSDPALARALDLLKGLAVVRSSNS